MSIDVAQALDLSLDLNGDCWLAYQAIHHGLLLRCHSYKWVKPRLKEVTFAVGVEGMPRSAGAVPVSGILGNNVLSQFVVDIDYVSNTLTLHQPDDFEMPSDSVSGSFDGGAFASEIALLYSNGSRTQTSNLTIKIDTGSRGLLLNANHVPQLAQQSTRTAQQHHGNRTERTPSIRAIHSKHHKDHCGCHCCQQDQIKGPFEATILQMGPKTWPRSACLAMMSLKAKTHCKLWQTEHVPWSEQPPTRFS